MNERETPIEATSENEPIDTVDAIASLLHEDWRSSVLQAQGIYEPRGHASSDSARSISEGLATDPYEDLPEELKTETKAAAQAVTALLETYGTDIDLQNAELRTKIGRHLHNEWLARHEPEWAGKLDIPFDELDADHQADYLNQMVIGLDYAKKNEQKLS